MRFLYSKAGIVLLRAILVFCICLMGGEMYAQEPIQELTWSLKASKEKVFPGEPVMLVVGLENSAERPVRVRFGPDGIGAITSVEVLGIAGKTVKKGGQVIRGGITPNPGEVVVQPHSKAEKTLVLNRWCSTRLPEGKYEIVCYVQPWSIQPVEIVEVRCSLEVVKMDEKEFTNILSRLGEKAFNNTGVLSEKIIASEMLAFADSPLAVSYQLRIAKENLYTGLKEDAITGLARVGNLEAAKALVLISEEISLPSYVRDRAIIAIYELREEGSPEILAATGKTVSKYKRPVKAEIID